MNQNMWHSLPPNQFVNLAMDEVDSEKAGQNETSGGPPNYDVDLLIQTSEKNGVLDTKDGRRKSTTLFEPYNHRSVDQTLSYTEALCHMIKGALGTGILTMPHAFKNSGYLLGFLATLTIGAFTNYCVQILVRAQYEICRRTKTPSLTYPQILGAALHVGPEKFRWLAPYGTCLSFVALVIDEMGALCVYILFIADSMRQVCRPFVAMEDLRLYILALLPILLLLSWLPNLKNIVPLSTAATGVMGVSLGITLYYTLQDMPPLSERNAVGPPEQFPLFLGVTLFSLSSIGVTMPLENEMRHPHQFSSPLGVLNVASALNALIFATFGLLGYLKYGDAIEGSITLNLPQGAKLTPLVQLLLSGAILFTFPLPQFIVYDIVWNRYLKQKMSFQAKRSLHVWDYGVRTLIVVLTVSFAVLIPNLDLFISLIGSLCLGLLTLIIPAMVDLLTFWPQYGHGLRRLGFVTRNLFIILVGIIGSGIGVYFSMVDLVKVYGQDGESHE